MIKHADVIIGLSYGDEGKGKVTNSLLKKGGYTHCIRFNGSSNAGHTIYKDGKKFVSHVVPTGLFQGVKSIIGPGCVVSPRLLEDEIKQLNENGLQTKGLLFVDKRTNLVSAEHLYEDGKDEKIGTTRRGNGPAYRDKYARKNIRFGDLPWNNEHYNVCDIYEELFDSNENVVLMEGAQAFGLDIDWGDYPYVTSSHCGVGSAIQNGIPFNKIRNVYGVCKAYETYVGNKKFESDDPIFAKIREVGQEFGATTGRLRQVDYLDLDFLVRSARINGVTHLIMNKLDVLEEVGVWKFKINNRVEAVSDKREFIQLVTELMTTKLNTIKNIYYSTSPEDI
jgi:adenylosuccinate synthase